MMIISGGLAASFEGMNAKDTVCRKIVNCVASMRMYKVHGGIADDAVIISTP